MDFNHVYLTGPCCILVRGRAPSSLSLTPRSFGEIAKGTKEAVAPAMAQGFLHWGFWALSILGSLAALPLMYYHYHKGLALKARLFLYPVFGNEDSE